MNLFSTSSFSSLKKWQLLYIPIHLDKLKNKQTWSNGGNPIKTDKICKIKTYLLSASVINETGEKITYNFVP